MPRIPMSDKGGLVQHQRDSVPMSGAPGMSFKLDEGQAWKEIGAQIGRAGESFGGAMMNYAKAAQDTDNKLAASQARNLFSGIQGELGSRMAENPQDFGKFREWAQEADKRYADEVKQYTDKMSQGYRKEFEVEMDGLRTRALQDRVRKGIQAKVTADYELLQAQWKDAALRGDEAESRRLLDEHRGVLISEQEYQQKLLDYGRMCDSGAAKRLVESGAPGAVERLKAQKDGVYTEFGRMSEEYRTRLIRIAEDQTREREDSTRSKFLADMADGNVPELSALKEAHDSGQMSDKMYAWQHDLVASYNARADKARADQASAIRADKRARALLELELLEMPSDGGEKSALKEELFAKVQKDFPSDWKVQHEYLTALNTRFKDGSVFDTPAGKLCSQIVDKAYKDRKLGYRPWAFWRRETGDDFQAARYLELLKWQESELQKGSPVETIIKGTQERIKMLNSGEIRTFLENAIGETRGKIGTMTMTGGGNAGEIEREVHGRIAIFGADKKFIRWKDGGK